MAEQERKQPRRSDSARETAVEPVVPRDVGGELADRIDGLLDEIDSVLEENAEQFVRDYVQKGGQ
jgi:ubiquitin-like protein Pup